MIIVDPHTVRCVARVIDPAAHWDGGPQNEYQQARMERAEQTAREALAAAEKASDRPQTLIAAPGVA